LFDFDLHFRFLRKATEAYFEMGQASFAAAIVWQSRLHESLTSERREASSPPALWPMWFGDWTGSSATRRTLFEDPFQFSRAPAPSSAPWQAWLENLAPAAQRSAFEPLQSWFEAMSTWQNLWQQSAMAACGASLSALPTSASTSLWNFSRWTAYQAPLISTMLAYGIPYTVAAPAARASTLAMDAADAAYTQWRQIFEGPARSHDYATALPSWQAYRL
jgi:hypothetical protein